MFNTTIQSIHQKLTSREVEVLWKNLKVSPETVIFYLRNPDFEEHPLTHKFLIELTKEKRKLNWCSYLTKEQLTKSEVIQWFIEQLCTLSVTDIEKSFEYLLRNDQSYHSLQPPSSFSYLEPMEYGYCTDERMECESDYCQLCSKWYIPKEELRMHSDKLMDFSQSYKKRIQERLKTMERLRANMEFDSKENTVSHMEKSSLIREAKNLKGEIEELAKIQSLIGGTEDE